MLKSPEEYLSTLEFDSGSKPGGKPALTPGEKAFVEKYLGSALLEDLPEVNPEPVPLPTLSPPLPPRLPEASPEPLPQLLPDPQALPTLAPPPPSIIVAPPHIDLEVATAQADIAPAPVDDSAPTVEMVGLDLATHVETVLETPVAETTETALQTTVETTTSVATETVAPVVSEVTTAVTAEVETVVPVEAQVAVETPVAVSAPVETATQVEAPAKVEAPVAAEVATEIVAQTQVATATEAPSRLAIAVSAAARLKEKLRQEAEVQLVSFFVSNQLFLLPVEGIQEVLRHMELIKVPQAPEFVAGAINLRGQVMPVVYLSALLTNGEIQPYDESNFIIITGTEDFRLGLIIDKVNSMHLVPQKSFIWNPESKLADAAEFLNAIVTLDDRVCGMVAPEAITRLILPELQ